MTPKEAIDIAVVRGRVPEYEHIIAMSATESFEYAAHILEDIFPLGEPIIAESYYYSYLYSRYNKKPFTLGEPAIAKNGWYGFQYAKIILNHRFKLCENNLLSNNYIDYYIKFVLNFNHE